MRGQLGDRVTRERTVCIFGGSGFIGSHAAERYIAGGDRVVIADLVPPAHDLLEHPLIQYVACDVRERINLAYRPTLILNLAAVHRTPGHPDHSYYDTNVGGALRVTQWAAEAECQRLIFTSSIAIYGAREETLTETSVPAPNTAYGRSKILAEDIHLRWAVADKGRKVSIVRPAVIFGPREKGNFTRLARALKQRRFVYPGRSDTIKACAYVEDLVDLFVFLEQQAVETQVLNFAYPTPSTIEDICAAFADVAGYRRPWARSATFLGPAVSLLGKLSERDVIVPGTSRIQKLTRSTDVRPATLSSQGFVWRTDLRTAIAEWMRISASSGRFE